MACSLLPACRHHLRSKMIMARSRGESLSTLSTIGSSVSPGAALAGTCVGITGVTGASTPSKPGMQGTLKAYPDGFPCQKFEPNASHANDVQTCRFECLYDLVA